MNSFLGLSNDLSSGANLIIDLGKVEAIMPMRHYPKTEKYQSWRKSSRRSP